ncbi:flagellar protein FlgN [Enterovibrio makurazakiensis]|uniref:Flagellar protein FlgN n=1 Tax=Enterovibrio gelatinilyticus TaxID=2899819 RepID=A0ABT5QZV5_9GAMM|nr:flagellar protein FlgN [Enterovibrio sp. ZSDZ42]MDD1793553.1 flagellar protein FlgN [Enterovibrio sp. ZSDZ42]
MTDRTTLVKNLLSDLANDAAQYADLESLLSQQHTFLNRRESQSLNTINARVQPLMDSLNSRAQRRVKCLELLGVSADDAGMRKVLAALPEAYGRQGLTHWQSIYDLAKRCQEQNNANGRLLAQQKQIFDKLLKPENAFSYAPNL